MGKVESFKRLMGHELFNTQDKDLSSGECAKAVSLLFRWHLDNGFYLPCQKKISKMLVLKAKKISEILKWSVEDDVMFNSLTSIIDREGLL